MIPCANYEAAWPRAAQEDYQTLLQQATNVIHVSEKPYSAARLELADQWMVNHVQALLALYDGEARGGTAKCVAYARSKNVHVVNVWQQF